jgi:diguanylate cyclase
MRHPRAAALPLAQRAAPRTPALRAYSERVATLAERIRATEDISAIIEMLNEALVETRQLRASDDELAQARRKVAEAERNIEAMTSELEQVKALVQQDPLTGTLNRRGIDDAFRREAARCDRNGTRLCVALIDLDDFKRINDTYGHPVGDRALRHVADIARDTLRPTDRIGRFGGEEFLFLLPDIGATECVAVLDRIKRSLCARALVEAGVAIKIAFSGGVVERVGQETLNDLIARADGALYEAKRAGKNRITLAS